MERLVELKRPYISVNGSYGGSQELFKGERGFFNARRARSGCGVVAIADTLGYLTGKTRYSAPDSYKSYFKYIQHRILWLPNRAGMSIYRIAFMFPRLLKDPLSKYRCFWGISRRRMLPRIEEMLKNDIPVIINIPKIISIRHRRDKLNLYMPAPDNAQNSAPGSILRAVSKTSAHFVVITGIYKSFDKIYLQISSWGRKYYIDFDEFSAFTKKTPFGAVFGNILYISH